MFLFRGKTIVRTASDRDGVAVIAWTAPSGARVAASPEAPSGFPGRSAP